jgi:hypothetical protein
MFAGFARNAKSRKSGVLIDPRQSDAWSEHGLNPGKTQASAAAASAPRRGKAGACRAFTSLELAVSAARHDREKLDLPGAGCAPRSLAGLAALDPG